jgi:hypothetical protein
LSFAVLCIRVAALHITIQHAKSMNRKRGQVSTLTLLMLISLLLFKGVAAAAMFCCGPEHSTHAKNAPVQHQAVSTHQDVMTSHCHDAAPEPLQISSTQQDHAEQTSLDHHLNKDHQVNKDQQNSCSGCAASCASIVLLNNSTGFLAEPITSDRIHSSTVALLSLTHSGLERPPRLSF